MKHLSINDKSHILGVNNIENKYILGNNRKVIIFEYLSKFEESFLFKKVFTLGFDFQVKIKKELYKNCEEKLLSSKYINIEALYQKNNEKYSIILNEDKEDELKTSQIQKEDLEDFISEEKGEQYIYRHYVIIDIPQKDNIEAITYEFISQIREINSIIKILNKNDLQDYLKEELYMQKKENLEDEEKESLKFYEIFTNPSKLSYISIQKINKFLHTVEKSFFQQKIENIDEDVLDILSTPTFKGDNFIKIGNKYKGGLYLKGIPKDNFNILKYLFLYLEPGDSISIHMYPESKHTLKEKELEGVEKYLTKKEKKETNDIYMQVLINMSEINNILLDKKIEKFQLIIGEDFYTQRITGVMSNYFTTYIGTGENKLQLERLYNKERLINNLLF